MSIFTRDKVYISADRASYIQYDAGTGLINFVVDGVTVASMSASAISLNKAANNLVVDNGTATAASSAATLNKLAGKITSESLTTAAGAAETLTITNDQVAAADIVLCSVANGDNAAGIPMIGRVTPGAGSFTVTVENQHGTNAFNGTVVVSFFVIKVA